MNHDGMNSKKISWYYKFTKFIIINWYYLCDETLPLLPVKYFKISWHSCHQEESPRFVESAKKVRGGKGEGYLHPAKIGQGASQNWSRSSSTHLAEKPRPRPGRALSPLAKELLDQLGRGHSDLPSRPFC